MRRPRGRRRAGGSGRQMSPRISPAEWDELASAVGVRWFAERPQTQSDRCLCECLGCGNRWEANPKTIRYGGKGCPPCASRARADGRSHSRSVWDDRAQAVGIDWIGAEPVRSGTKHRARCRKCGYEWAAWPGNIQQGGGCPQCGNESKARTRVPPPEQLIRFQRAGLEWVGDGPTLNDAPVRTRCLACGHVWRPRPKNIQQGHGCPRCSRTRPPQEG